MTYISKPWQIIAAVAVIALAFAITFLGAACSYGDEGPWSVFVDTGSPPDVMFKYQPRTELIRGGNIYQAWFSTAPEVQDAAEDFAEALNSAHLRRTMPRLNPIPVPKKINHRP